MIEGNPIRLYSVDEIKSVFHNFVISVGNEPSGYASISAWRLPHESHTCGM